jgi:hypothetical protein
MEHLEKEAPFMEGGREGGGLNVDFRFGPQFL